jgi:K+-transporting ATPase A subunit
MVAALAGVGRGPISARRGRARTDVILLQAAAPVFHHLARDYLQPTDQLLGRPLSVLGALVLVGQGAMQTFSGSRTASPLADRTQTIPSGPVASMEVIKLLGTNGGSFYGVGGAHPFENPTGFTNMFDAEVHGNPHVPATITQVVNGNRPGGKMEGKETWLAPEGSALMTVGTIGTTA